MLLHHGGMSYCAMRQRNGFALAVVLLIATVALTAAVGAATVSVISGRTTASQERRATSALLAAESGINTFQAHTRAVATRYHGGSPKAWLEEHSSLTSGDLGDGTGFQIEIIGGESEQGVFSVRSTGTATGESAQVVIQDFLAAMASGPDMLPNAGAIVTQRTFKAAGRAVVAGRSADELDWVWMGVELSDGLTGEYFETVDGTLYRIVDHRERVECDDAPELTTCIPVVDVAADNSTMLLESTEGTLRPFALAEAIDAPADTTFAVSNVTLYSPGLEVYIGTNVGVITDVDAENGLLTVNWTTGTAASYEEGTTIRTVVPSVVYDPGTLDPSDACRVEGGASLPQGCEPADLSNLWDQTFGDELDMATMLGLAQCDEDVIGDLTTEERIDLYGPTGECQNSYYGPDSAQNPVAEWPDTLVSGVTWIDGANTGAFNSRGGGGGGDSTTGRAICGEGVVILNTGVYAGDEEEGTSKINLNVDDCDFSGVLYIMGEVMVQGNLSRFSGTIIIQTGDETSVQGTGGGGGTNDPKATYDPLAVRKALGALPISTPTSPSITALPTTYRLGSIR